MTLFFVLSSFLVLSTLLINIYLNLILLSS
nr:MAG TPA: hypothetical protein [Caudoviricetes sp.]